MLRILLFFSGSCLKTSVFKQLYYYIPVQGRIGDDVYGFVEGTYQVNLTILETSNVTFSKSYKDIPAVFHGTAGTISADDLK
jgi:hypothetical protein